MTIAGGISATKAGFGLIKGVRELVKRPEVDLSEVSARLLELQELMLEARDALNEAQEEKLKLEVRIADLSRMSDIGNSFTFDGGLYWFRDFPYCPNCWDVDRKPIRLTGPYGFSNTDWDCPIHKQKYYHKKFYQAPHF